MFRYQKHPGQFDAERYSNYNTLNGAIKITYFFTYLYLLLDGEFNAFID